MSVSTTDGPTGRPGVAPLETPLVGPVTLQPSFPFVAYVLHVGQGLPPLCFTAHLDDHHVLRERMSELARASYHYVTTQLTNWRDLHCVVVRVQDGCEHIVFEVFGGPETDLEDIARAALRAVTATFVRLIGEVRCVVRQSAPENEDIRCRHDFWIEDTPQRKGHLYLDADPDHMELDKALQVFVAMVQKSGAFDDIDRNMYVLEAGADTDPLSAFRSFSHAAVQSPDTADAGLLLDLGIRVWNLLSAHAMSDYAEWVAATMARLAGKGRDRVAEIAALRLQGISQAELGCWAASVACFERALLLLPEVNDTLIEARLRMSYGLAIMDLSAHWEALDRETRRQCMPELLSRLGIAEQQLLGAQTLLAELQESRAQRELAFISLELLRIRDLRGDHTGTLSELSAIPAASTGEPALAANLDEADRNKYDATVAHYRVCAALKLCEAETARAAAATSDSLPATRLLIAEELPHAVAQINALPQKTAIVDRLCYIAVLASNVYVDLALGLQASNSTAAPGDGDAAGATAGVTLESYRSELEQARTNLESALALRRRREVHEARPPLAGIEYGGLPAIDIVGPLQHCLLLLAQLRREPALVWQAFAAADEAKGRFFKRDLAFSGWPPVQGAPTYVAGPADDLRRALLRGEADHRLLMADLEWSLQHDLAPDVAAALRSATSFEGDIGLDEIRTLLDGDGTPTAVLALYATARESIAYLVTSADRPPYVARLVVGVGELEGIARDLGVIVADELRNDPGLGSRALPRALERLLLPMLEQLAGVVRLVIVPHGPWHGIPVHAVLLPVLWKSGHEAGIIYTPSLRAMQLLQRRREARRGMQRSAIAVATVPAREDPPEPFEQQHTRLVRLLHRSHRPVDAAFGCEATLDRLLLQSGAVGIRHIIAHGIDAGSDHAMQSGILVADGAALPSRAGAADAPPMLTATLELAHPTVASHVTVQACEIGRVYSAHRDELWGMTRALIAGGADTVLAPIWEVSLRSSGELLRDFYRRWLIEGVPPALALSRAQRAMAEGRTQAYRHFAHWGAFQMVGC